jgi:hypothetical protein
MQNSIHCGANYSSPATASTCTQQWNKKYCRGHSPSDGCRLGHPAHTHNKSASSQHGAYECTPWIAATTWGILALALCEGTPPALILNTLSHHTHLGECPKWTIPKCRAKLDLPYPIHHPLPPHPQPCCNP